MFGKKKSFFKKILAVVDNSDISIHAAEFAVNYADTQDADLYVVTVVDTDTINRLMKIKIFIEEEKEEFELDLERTAKKNLNYIKEMAESKKVDVKTFLLKGNIHKMVLRKAEDIDADLIVLGGWKLSIIKRDLLVRERQLILDEAKCCVIIVKEEVSL
jgi:nucleotide-binding universal stress UspA family protein